MAPLFSAKSGRPLAITSLAIIFIAGIILFTLSKPQKKPLKIGVIISLTGTGSHLVDLKDGMLLAIDEVNTHGGINGGRLELIIEDNRTDPKEAEKIFTRLENTVRPTLYVSALSSIGMALKPLAEKNEVVLVGLNTSAPEFSSNSYWTFRHYYTAEEESRLTQQLLGRLHVKSLGIIYLDDPYGDGVKRKLERKFKNMGGRVTSASFQNNVQDMKTQVEAVSDMEVVYLIGFSKHFAMAIKQLRRSGYQGIIIMAAGGANPRITEMAEAEGIYLAAPLIYNFDYSFADIFRQKFETRFGRSMSHQAANGYDFVMILTGLLNGREISRDSIRRILEQGFLYSGLLGDQELKPLEREINIPLQPAIISDGRIRFFRE